MSALRSFFILLVLIVALFVSGIAIGVNVHAQDIARLQRAERAACADRKLNWHRLHAVIEGAAPYIPFPPTADPELRAAEAAENQTWANSLRILTAENDGIPVC